MDLLVRYLKTPIPRDGELRDMLLELHIQAYSVLETYLLGDSRKNELYFAKHIPHFQEQFSVPVSIGTETKVEPFWRNLPHWLHRQLSKWQLPVQPVTKILSSWRRLHLRVGSYERAMETIWTRLCAARSRVSFWYITVGYPARRTWGAFQKHLWALKSKSS